jgi:transposase
MIQVDDLSRSLIAFEQISTLVIVVELSQSSWLAAGETSPFTDETLSGR